MKPSRINSWLELGPQYSKDNEFTAKMRLHQSWYRTKILRVPCGVGPKKSDKNFYGNMLKEEDGKLGLNFSSLGIFHMAQRRIAEKKGTIDEFRLNCNMLSSQPMCFNLFGQSEVDHNLASNIFQKLLPGEISQVTRILFEHFPEPKNEYLDDATAFDAFVEYVDFEGRLSFVGIETKLTEPFSQKWYDLGQPKYSRWMRNKSAPWRQDILDKTSNIEYNQLCRDHLLAVAMTNHSNSKYHSGYLMLVRHPHDKECASVVSKYRNLLQATNTTFIDMPLNVLINFCKEIVTNDENRFWLDRFQLRYLDLDVGSFAMRYDKSSFDEVRCSICFSPIKSELGEYPYPVCESCDKRALNRSDQPAQQFRLDASNEQDVDENTLIIDAIDDGDNSVFIDEIKCWRRYRFGGWITMRDIFWFLAVLCG